MNDAGELMKRPVRGAFLQNIAITLLGLACGCSADPEVNSAVQPEHRTAPRSEKGFIILASQHRGAGTSIPEELKTNADAVDIVAPMWFDVTDDGAVVPAKDCSGPYTTYLEFCREHGVRLMPIVRNFLPKALLSNAQAVKACAENTAALARREGFDGIVMDIEDMQPELQPALVSLMQKLYPLLQKQGLRLCVAVNARAWGKWDYSNLALHSDWLYVMFYDYTGPWNKSVIGPTAPIDWPERSADIRRDLHRILAVGTPPEKILFGIPLYGDDFKLNTAGGASTITVDYLDSLLELQRRHGVQRLWDETKKCPYFDYQDGQGETHRVWYDDAESFRAKIQLARDSKLAGIAFWSLRGTPKNVNSDFWETVKKETGGD